jgi:hypothetical protein
MRRSSPRRCTVVAALAATLAVTSCKTASAPQAGEGASAVLDEPAMKMPELARASVLVDIGAQLLMGALYQTQAKGFDVRAQSKRVFSEACGPTEAMRRALGDDATRDAILGLRDAYEKLYDALASGASLSAPVEIALYHDGAINERRLYKLRLGLVTSKGFAWIPSKKGTIYLVGVSYEDDAKQPVNIEWVYRNPDTAGHIDVFLSANVLNESRPSDVPLARYLQGGHYVVNGTPIDDFAKDDRTVLGPILERVFDHVPGEGRPRER